MRSVVFDDYGGPDVLHVAEVPTPRLGADEVLIAVEAAGIGNADRMQRQGTYPPPPGTTTRLGLEAAGTVARVGSEVTRWRVGDRVCALVAGGSCAEFVAAPQGQVLPIPDGWTAIEAASLPENGFTVYDNLFTRARLAAGELLLVHGGTSGVGTIAIAFATALGAGVYATAGSADKCAACVRLGALDAIPYREKDFVAEIAALTDGRGVDVVLDVVGGDYVARDVECLAPDGRVVCLSTARGTRSEIDLGKMLARRASILASSLRPRSVAQKTAIARALEERIWPLLPEKRRIVPVIDSVFTFEDAAQAHRRLESGEHIGKIVLTP
ncbi:MAG TPA: NAD(P)H-quinone oxidoreductase [Candidatus Baltobacteraceae bacterium]